MGSARAEYAATSLDLPLFLRAGWLGSDGYSSVHCLLGATSQVRLDRLRSVAGGLTVGASATRGRAGIDLRYTYGGLSSRVILAMVGWRVDD